MAKKKKSRTPAPPRSRSRPSGQGTATPQRPVQAPQVRTGKRRTQEDVDRRNRYILYGLAASGIVGLAAALIAVFALGGGNKGGTANVADNGPNVNFAAVPGVRRTKAPWSNDTKTLRQRLKPIGLTPLPQEGLAQHKHAHLDFFVNGKRVVPPRYIGIHEAPAPAFITEIHTHDAGTDGQPPTPGKLPNETATGVIHIESPDASATYSLGQFFGVWGVFLSKQCVGGYCGTAGTPLKFYVNGKPFNGNPVTLVLDEHEEIAIVYGTPPAKIPSSYNWGNL